MKQEKLMMTIRLWAIILCTVLGILLLMLVIFNEEVYRKVAVEAVEFTLFLILPVLILGVITLRDMNGLMRRVKEREDIFHIVSCHSHRTLYSYDLASGKIQLWNEGEKQEVLHQLFSGHYQHQGWENDRWVMEDSVEDLREFFTRIHSGCPSGELKLHIRVGEEEDRWYDVQYSNIFEGNRAITTIISAEDITKEHDHELAYLRYLEAIEVGAEGCLFHIESDLTEDKIEKVRGDNLQEDSIGLGSSHREFFDFLFGKQFWVEDAQKVSHLFLVEGLREQYYKGNHQLKDELKVRFPDGQKRWMGVEIILVEDPFNHHIKSLTKMMDITEQWEEHLSIVKRADYDAMTGLLRRDVGESQIRTELKISDNYGVLVILDLDDLKGINDQLGHDQGDKAIRGMADMIRKHFRKEDILVRVGGDEFIVFLKGAGKDRGAVEEVVAELLRKISEITIGENGERMLHCSIGCAVEQEGGDSFESLFKRADRALYHVKRNGKNNYAFYLPEMEDEDYAFRSNLILYERNSRELKRNEMKSLVDSIMYFHDLVMAINLTTNTYYIINEVKNGVFRDFSPYGELDAFLEVVVEMIPKEEREEFYRHLGREQMLKAYYAREKYIHYCFPFIYEEKSRKVECSVILYSNEKGDVCDFTMLRWIAD